MADIPDLPATLQKKARIVANSLNIQAVDNIARASVEVGPAKQRPRSTAESKELQCGVFVPDVATRDAYEAWHHDDLAMGALPFRWPALAGLIPGNYDQLKHTAKPGYRREGDGWRITLELLAIEAAPPIELVRDDMGLSSLIDYSRAGEGTRWNADGKLEIVPADQRRIDFDPVTGEFNGLLKEIQKTNKLDTSDESVFGIFDSSSTDETVSSDGTFIENLHSSIRHVVSSTGSDTGSATVSLGNTNEHTFWVSVRVVSGSAGLRVSGNLIASSSNLEIDATGAIVSQSSGIERAIVNPIGDGWFIVGAVFSPISSEGAIYIRIGSESEAYFAIGQVEEGDWISSYIPTNGGQKTRAEDILEIKTLDWFQNIKGTLYLDVNWLDSISGGNQGFLSFSSSGLRPLGSFSGGSNRINSDDGNVTLGSNADTDGPTKMVLTWGESGRKVFYNGTILLDDSYDGSFLESETNGVIGFNGRRMWFKSVAFYPRRMSDAEAEAMTT